MASAIRCRNFRLGSIDTATHRLLAPGESIIASKATFKAPARASHTTSGVYGAGKLGLSSRPRASSTGLEHWLFHFNTTSSQQLKLIKRLHSTGPVTSSNETRLHDDSRASTSTSSTSSPSLASNDQPSNTTQPVHQTSSQHPTYLASLPRSLRRLAANLPSPPGRPPSRDQLLSLTTSFFQRVRIRFKWATIRSYRHFRADDWSAFFSFGILGTLGWFMLGTTSFFAFGFFVVNSLSSQNWLGKKLGQYMTKSTGVQVVFESAIVPKWGFAGGGSKIVFKNVYISRGPVKTELGVLSSSSAAAASNAASAGSEEDTEEQRELREQMARWTHFHLGVDTIEVSLSLRRWLDGKGLIKDAVIRGVRGVVDRSHIQYDPDAPRDRFAYRHTAKLGDFHLESLQIEDFLVTIYQPDQFRPYTFSIFNADIRRLRKQWLFYDLMSAESITGQVDNCLFSLHKPQSIGRTSEEDLKDVHWVRMSRFRIDGVPIDHLQSSHDTGVMSWVTSGRCDLVADIRFPRDESDIDLSTIVADLVDEIGSHLTPSQAQGQTNFSLDRGARIPGRSSLSKDALQAPKDWKGGDKVDQMSSQSASAMTLADVRERTIAPPDSIPSDFNNLADFEVEDDSETRRRRELNDRIVSIDLDIRFKDLKASVPYFTSNLSYVNNALVRPIVAFINSNKTLVPVRCHIDLSLSEFDGSWTTYDVGLLDRMSEEASVTQSSRRTYAALAHHVQNANQQRLQAVSLWTLQKTAQGVIGALRQNLTPYY
ncbi:Mitochondrial distribution and morphology protein 31, mitochondrial precursor [Microbotryomycetes sp. JL221]|nr:Mitochondrial distribution and morphology protein 31, mitochondrial precursor [Microbotryomycetes sp. JL221]